MCFKTKIPNIVALGITVSTGICRGWRQTDKVYATLPSWAVTLIAPQWGPEKPSLFLWAHAALRTTPTLRRTLHLFWIFPLRRPPNCHTQKSQTHFGKLLPYAKYGEMVPGNPILLKWNRCFLGMLLPYAFFKGVAGQFPKLWFSSPVSLFSESIWP